VAGSFDPTVGSLDPAAKECDDKSMKVMARKKKQSAEDKKKRTDLSPRPCTLTQIGKFDNAEGTFLLKTSIDRCTPINVIQKSLLPCGMKMTELKKYKLITTAKGTVLVTH